MAKKLTATERDKLMSNGVKLLVDAIARGDSDDIKKYRREIKGLIADADGYIAPRFEKVLKSIL